MDTKIFALFMLVVTSILVALHIGLAIGWVWVFALDGNRTPWLWFIGLGLSFPVTSAIVFWRETRLTNSLYALASVWLGFSLYVAMAVLLGVGVGLLGLWLDSNLPLNALMAIFLTGAAAYAGYGLWNALHPVVKKITVRIPNLPLAWQGKIVVQLSDMHLGPINREWFAKRAVQLANSQNPAAVCITGDLFDGGGLELHKLADPLKNLKSEFGTFYITGNHETYVGVDRSLEAIKNLPFSILRDQKVEVAGLQILGIDYPLPNEKKNMAPVLAQLDRTKPNIVLYHEPKFINEFRAAGANLVLCGHTHVGQMWPFGYITRKVYHGYDYGLHEEGTFNQYTSSGVGTWGPPMRTGNRPEVVAITLQAS